MSLEIDSCRHVHQRTVAEEKLAMSLKEPLGSDAMLDQWDQKIHSDRLGLKYSGCYYRFEDAHGVLDEGSDDICHNCSDIEADTPCILTSCSKVFAGTAVMRTMHLMPEDWYPEKGMHEFIGWETWRDFPVYDNECSEDKIPSWSGRVVEKITIDHLLLHTSGWPFGLRGKRHRIKEMPLYFEPGSNFGYSIGHRILGWMLLDYWKRNEPPGYKFSTLNDVFAYLVYEPLGLTNTFFIHDKFQHPHSLMGRFFSMKYFDNPLNDLDDDPADLAMASSGADMMKLCMMALRRGHLPDGTVYIKKWDDWAATNKLPGNKLSSALANWRLGFDDINFLWRTLITRTVNAGPFGWSYFGATYHGCDPKCEGDAGPVIAVGWKGFSSCGLRADYEQDIAFIVMQECVPDPGNRNFAECIHEGKCGDFKLGEIGRKLACTSKEQIIASRDRYTKKVGCCHEVMTETKKKNCCLHLARFFIKCAYRISLPLGVKVLKFHKHERLAEKARTKHPKIQQTRKIVGEPVEVIA